MTLIEQVTADWLQLSFGSRLTMALVLLAFMISAGLALMGFLARTDGEPDEDSRDYTGF